jgi:hypothetical protein
MVKLWKGMVVYHKVIIVVKVEKIKATVIKVIKIVHCTAFLCLLLEREQREWDLSGPSGLRDFSIGTI